MSNAAFTLRDLTLENWMDVYQVLVKHGGAPDNESDEDCFLQAHYPYDSQQSEYRICWALGFGGKLWCDHDRLYVNYYREDRTPKRDKLERDANAALSGLLDKWRGARVLRG